MGNCDKRLHIKLFVYILAVIIVGAVLIPVFGGKDYLYAIGSFGSDSVGTEKKEVKTHGRMLFVGDVLLARDVERKLERKGSAYPYTHMSSVFDTHRYQVANFEASIPAVHQPTADFTYLFSVKDEHAATLIEQGFTHLSLANNHSFDFGSDGFVSTSETLASLDATPFGVAYDIGTSSLAVIENGSVSVGLIGLDLTVTEFDIDSIETLFTYAADVSDIQIVYIHWGEEYARRHSDTQETVAQTLIEQGADLIIGHHPHVVQDIALYKGVPVFYSLGNFIFDQYFSPDVQKGLALSVDVYEGDIELIPVTSIGSRVSPQLMDAEEKKEFLTDLAKISEKVLFEEILNSHISL